MCQTSDSSSGEGEENNWIWADNPGLQIKIKVKMEPFSNSPNQCASLVCTSAFQSPQTSVSPSIPPPPPHTQTQVESAVVVF